MDILSNVIDIYGFGVVPFFVAMVFILAFGCLNVPSAVLASRFSLNRIQKAEEKVACFIVLFIEFKLVKL